MKDYIKIRFAERRDVPALVDMAYGFQDHFNKGLGDDLEFPPPGRLEQDLIRLHFSDAPMLQTLVAEMDGVGIVGRISFYRGWAATWYLRFHMSGFFVLPEYRGMKIADKLFGALVDLARSEGAKKIVWNLWRPNKVARRFYEKMGGTYLASGSPAEGDPDDVLYMQYKF
ncbi:MAG: GNAT family N-acetyltransferase [Alphaproteobacteria bacterium]|nr:GNAT family N-acetyltransferase [Alphaproteobacteria bacterium]